MSQTSLHELLQLLRYDYRQTPGKGARGDILDQWCRASGQERKYAIKVLRGQRGPGVVGARLEGPPVERGGSVKVYGPELVGILKAIWLQNEQPCGKRLLAVLPLLVPSWERHYGELDPAVKSGLLKISRTQIDRVLAPFRTRAGPRRPSPGSEVRRQVC